MSRSSIAPCLPSFPTEPSNGGADDAGGANRSDVLPIPLGYELNQIKTDDPSLQGDARDQVYNVEVGQATWLRDNHAWNNGRIEAVAVDGDQAIRTVFDRAQN